MQTGERMEEMIRIARSSRPIFFRTPGVALWLWVARRERDDFRMKRVEDSVSLAIGSKLVLNESFSFRRYRSLLKTAQFEHASHQCPVGKRR
jgi:hypothetical protein